LLANFNERGLPLGGIVVLPVQRVDVGDDGVRVLPHRITIHASRRATRQENAVRVYFDLCFGH